MKRLIIYILITLIVIITGCASDKSTITPKQGTSLYKNFSKEITKGVNTIDINIDSGNLQIYCWDKKEIKFEVKHTVRDNKRIEELEKLLTKYLIISKEKGEKFLFTVNYKDKIIEPQDFYSDIKLTVPKRIKNINIIQEYGNIIIEDKYQGNITCNLGTVNSEIKYIKGKLIYNCDAGNIRLNSGKLFNGSCVDIKLGSIFIKAEGQEQARYSFQTEIGNIDLAFPVSSNILVNSFGTVDNNQFTGIDGSIVIKVTAEMGKISVNGY